MGASGRKVADSIPGKLAKRNRRSLGSGQISKTVRLVLAGKLTWQWKIPRIGMYEAMIEGMTLNDIAAKYGVNHSHVSRAQHDLTTDEMLYIINKKGAKFNSAKPSELRAKVGVDNPLNVMKKIREILDKLDNMDGFMTSEAGVKSFATPAGHMSMNLQLTDRQMKALQLYVDISKTYTEMYGFEVWKRQLLDVLDEIDPNLKERVLEKFRQRFLDGYRGITGSIRRVNREADVMTAAPVMAGRAMESTRSSAISGNGSELPAERSPGGSARP